MKKILLVGVILGLSSLTLAQDAKQGSKEEIKAADRVQAAATVLDEVMAAPDKAIPEEILKSAECVAVVPSLLTMT